MSRISAIGALALAAFVGLGTAPAFALCDELDNQNATLEGSIRNISDVGVILFVDSKSGCEVGLVEPRIDRACHKGGQIEVTGLVTKNKYVAGTYSITRSRKAPSETLACR
ncbi:MAG: hypothetical protein Q8L22_09355 [Reyranella sp.]|nr:hypothetical protein [Reyranella sp.]